MITLVGYTGFVGSNIYAKGYLDKVYNTKNIQEAYGACPDLLIYAGIRAEKYLANSAPQKDMDQIRQAEENIRRIRPEKLVLISTIDVFKKPINVDENSEIEVQGLSSYGYNRYQLELWAREYDPNALIIRLPALFGKNLKKNFIYDYIHVVPSALKVEKMEELCETDPGLKNYYLLQDNGFYKIKSLDKKEHCQLKNRFEKIGFTALDFTDSRSRFQFYDLSRLWDDIEIALKAGIMLWHPATEPMSAGELYQYLTGREFVNELSGIPSDYNYKTVYAELFQGADGYIESKKTVLGKIGAFIKEQEKYAWK